jgi:hypothetical protein
MMIHAKAASVQHAYRSKAAHRRFAVQASAAPYEKLKNVLAVVGALALIVFSSWVVVMAIATQEEQQMIKEIQLGERS